MLNKSLKQLIKNLPDIKISGLSLNSQFIKKGEVFISLSDNKKHIIDAFEKGCVAVLSKYQYDLENVFYVKSLETQLEILAKNFYTNYNKAKIIAITGTNGKTTTAYLLQQTLNNLNNNCAYIGTLGVKSTQLNHTLANTTPDIFTLYKTIETLVNNKVQTIVLEASSHGLVQNRLAGLNIENAIFTNLSQDHLDYHQTMDDYSKAKMKLFNMSSLKNILVNIDDEFGKKILKSSKTPNKNTYSINDFIKKNINQNGFIVQINNHIFELPLLGEFNLMNALVVIKQLLLLDYELKDIIPALTKTKTIIGRMQRIKNSFVWVDFAHTPDALEKSLQTLKTHFPEKNIKVVFGCGGNRDTDKRSKMGRIAYDNADNILLTNDNPRDEDPEQIILDIQKGIPDFNNTQVIMDRTDAITNAIDTIKEDECVLIAGKGHETEQIIKNKKIPLCDITLAETLL